MNRVVFDTDVASFVLNQHRLGPAYEDATRGATRTLSFMSVAELRRGAISAGWGSRRTEWLEIYIGGFEVVYPNDTLCTIWARLVAGALRIGRPISVQDAWIAATAMSLGSSLATHNRKDYEHIKGLRLITL